MTKEISSFFHNTSVHNVQKKDAYAKGKKGCVIAMGLFFFLLMVVWGLAAALAPFLLGSIVAYVYYPLHQRFLHWGWSSLQSALLLGLTGYALLALGLWKGLPILSHWGHDMLYNIHGYSHKIQRDIWYLIKPVFNNSQTHIQQWIEQWLQQGVQWIGSFAMYLLYNGWSVLRVVYTLILAPLVSFYVTKDGPWLWRGVASLFPSDWRPSIRLSLRQCHRALCLYVAGQWRVSLLSMAYYTIFLHAGLDLPLFIALLTGTMVFFPYVGWITSMMFALAIGALNGGSWSLLCSILIVYIGGNVFEGLVLTPYFVGGRTGLHPLWVLLSVVLSGGLLGVFGIMFALPLATIIAALLRLWCASSNQNHPMQGGT